MKTSKLAMYFIYREKRTIRSCVGVIVCALLVSCDRAEKGEIATPAKLSEEAAQLDYNFHIRPILSDKCFFCHGPDAKNNKAGLRLDTAEGAYAALKESDGHGVVPGESEKSEVWKRISSTDPELVMPPIDSKIDLSAEEKNLIKKWIDQGAVYQKHWAFSNLREHVDEPKVVKGSWVRHPIDSFILKKLEDQGLEPSVASEPLLWLRRATFDLTGLPPTLEEMASFEKEEGLIGEQAYHDAVNKLLASPAYGEHQAVAWLDAARYADSYGFQSDQLNGQWPYRDWVVDAFNANLSYDKFLTYNLAGDLVPNATRAQIQATAFNRLHRLTNEGGSEREEFLVENAADRVHTFGTAVLGLTMECARCHDHKYDPISARDYYSLFAFFNSIPENGLYDHPSKVPSPSILLPTSKQAGELKLAKVKLEALEASLLKAKQKAEPAYQQWRRASTFPAEVTGLVAHYDFDQTLNNIQNLVRPDAKAGSAKALKLVDGVRGKAVECDGDHGVVFPESITMDRDVSFTVSCYLKDTQRSENEVVVLQKTYGTDVGYNGFDVVLKDGFLEARIYRVWPGNAISAKTTKRIPAQEWQHLTVSYDASSKAKGMRMYLDGAEVDTNPYETTMLKSSSVKTYGAGHLTVGQRFRDYGFKGGLVDELKVYDRELTGLEVVAEFKREPLGVSLIADSAKMDLLLREFYHAQIDANVQKGVSELEKANRALVKAEDSVLEVSVMRELPSPRPTHILERGEYSSMRSEENEVTRDTFETILPKFPESATRDRLGLVQWLVQDDHPLTSRVLVNRMWQNFFGKGIVSTPENFGLQGALPSHPDLLDWLSRDFINGGWDVKRLCRSIVLSSTYRQSSSTTAILEELDPENRLLARGPAYRLTAEQVRDLALASSGLLEVESGGPPVSPYQPGKDLWRESNAMSPAYRQSIGKALYRRSIYSVWKRTAPLPNMLAFDATSREVCSVERSKTNTPMQALVLLNDVQFLEAARVLASLAVEHGGGTDAEKIDFTFRRLAGRSPTHREAAVLLSLLKQQRTHYQKLPGDADKLLAHGGADASEHLSRTEVAAFSIVCQAILNLDATIWKR